MTKSVLFVCMGNICRSPTAEGVFRQLWGKSRESNNLFIDSAGTTGYHKGEKPDRRAVEAAKNRGYDLSKIRARQVENDDFEKFDLILAMDSDNFRYLETKSSPEHAHKIKLFLSYSTQEEFTDVPDPYYGPLNGFDLVIDLIEDASKGLIAHIDDNNP